MLDLHRHDEFSLFDGYGSSGELAKLALSKGYTALGSSNHGSTSGLIAHYFSCKDAGIKPVMGVEAYFQPRFDREQKPFHLCLFAKSLKGYENINRAITEANFNKFYRNPIVDFETLEKYSEGVICTSACVAGYLSRAVEKGKLKLAYKAVDRFVDILGDDFYIEIQPYKIDNEGTQERINKKLIEIAHNTGVRCILTSDSHYGSKEEFDTYVKMREMSGMFAKGVYDLEHMKKTYKERYMPDLHELEGRFMVMHERDFKRVKSIAFNMRKNLQELEDSIEDGILEQLEISLPKIGKNSKKLLKEHLIDGLKERGHYGIKKYMERIKEEYDVITYHGFEDYFLIVEDYVRYAKDRGIIVGPGRGSVCNSLAAYALGITDVDPIYFDLDFSRFLRKDKKKFPDIDLDFETKRRAEVIDYVIAKYPNKAVRISSYGLYKVDNLCNDLFKVCGVEDVEEKKQIKQYVGSHFENVFNKFDYEAVKGTKRFAKLNKEYDNILIHFHRLFGRAKYMGTHAAGVAISGDDIVRYTAIRRYKDAFVSAYDHNNIETINAVKLDILGLNTLSVLKELRELTGKTFDYTWLDDKEVYRQFRLENTAGVFQFEKPTAKKILSSMEADCMEDIIAANALNRPGPLSLGMPGQYAANKQNVDEIKGSRYYEYTKDTYGTIVYQEQIGAICRGMAGMTYGETDKVIRFMKSITMSEIVRAEYEREIKQLRETFISGAKKLSGVSEQEADEIFDKLTVYSFNKGHATAYAMISVQEMWYKIHYPTQFWYVKMKYAPTEDDLSRYKLHAVKDDQIVLLPHINGTAEYSLRKVDGELALQEGLVNVKNVGAKAAQAIQDERERNGKFTSYDDFINRVPKRTVNSRVVESLHENGALEFSKKRYFSRVKKYNSSLYLRGMRMK